MRRFWYRPRFVIVQAFRTGGRRWFRYHPHQVWVWTKQQDRAAVFQSRDDAIHAAESCSLSWQNLYRIEELPRR